MVHMPNMGKALHPRVFKSYTPKRPYTLSHKGKRVFTLTLYHAKVKTLLLGHMPYHTLNQIAYHTIRIFPDGNSALHGSEASV